MTSRQQKTTKTAPASSGKRRHATKQPAANSTTATIVIPARTARGDGPKTWKPASVNR